MPEELKEKEILADLLRQRAVSGIFSVTLGRIFIQIISVFCGIILARILIPEMFGVFAIASFVVTFTSLFYSLGLAAALVQQKEEPKEEELRTAFTVQQGLSLLLIWVIFFLSARIVSWYAWPERLRWLLVALSFSLFLGSWRSVPVVLLQRKMQFGRLIACEAAENFFFQATSVFLAYRGWGAWSFVWALLFSRLVSLSLLYRYSCWRPRYGIKRVALKKLLAFGVPYQLHDLLNMAKNSVVPLVVGKLCGAGGVGYFSWAESFLGFSLFFTGVIGEITFPVFSRSQEDQELLRKGIEKAVRSSAVLFFPLLSVLVVFARPIIHYLYTDKWLPGLGVFYLLAFSLVMAGPIGLIFFNAFYAAGKPYWVLSMDIVYLVLNFGLAVPLILRFGITGMAMVKVIVGYATFGVMVYLLRKIAPVEIFKNILPFFLPSLAVGLFFYWQQPVLVKSLFSLIFWAGSALALCFLATYFFNRQTIRGELKAVIRTLYEKKLSF